MPIVRVLAGYQKRPRQSNTCNAAARDRLRGRNAFFPQAGYQARRASRQGEIFLVNLNVAKAVACRALTRVATRYTDGKRGES